MGLDMYLEKHSYVAHYDAEKHAILPQGKVELPGIVSDRVRYVIEEVGYWRKANAIHAWFIKNCANGVDDCMPVFVSHERLQELLAIVREIRKDPSRGPALLPTQSGFFFGSTDYDEWYVKDLEHTETVLAAALAEPYTGDFYYRASW